MPCLHTLLTVHQITVTYTNPKQEIEGEEQVFQANGPTCFVLLFICPHLIKKKHRHELKATEHFCWAKYAVVLRMCTVFAFVFSNLNVNKKKTFLLVLVIQASSGCLLSGFA